MKFPPVGTEPRLAAGGGKDHGLQILANHFARVHQKRCTGLEIGGDCTVLKHFIGSVFLVVPAVIASACGERAGNVQSAAAAAPIGDKVMGQQLPINQRFGSLDEYLAFLEKTQAPVDGPWYRETSLGIFELQTGNFRPLGGKAPKRSFTRQELEKKFGFSR
jgi:hypothetical protein